MDAGEGPEEGIDVRGTSPVADSSLLEDALDPGMLSIPLPQIQGGSPVSMPSPFPEDLHDRIIKQVEYYFSDENLATDKYLMSFIRKDREGFVGMSLISSFKKTKKLSQETSVIVTALRKSSVLIVSDDGTRVRRAHPHPPPPPPPQHSDSRAVASKGFCTVRADNLPEGYSRRSLQQLFGQVGSVRKISVRDSPPEKPHALVDYESAEVAEKAVSVLSDDRDWRNGLKVRPVKPSQKSDGRRKPRKDQDSDKGCVGGAGCDVAGTAAEADDGDANKAAGRSRKLKYSGESSKPPPGPRMPDGTRGFAMGRGRPPIPM